MPHQFFDWKGNEIREGMVIYFVRTKPFNLGRMGMLIPEGISASGKTEEIWESDEYYEKRTTGDVWELGREYEVKISNDFPLTLSIAWNDGNNYMVSPLHFCIDDSTTIAIKGISDIK